eukprot:GHRR01012393.1.p2 GENE.GHRR01012393.1~~GHRR01012393.1.p2  ORF type:complete len:123 (-),score=5.33 GHRR01012393.1:846-1214(-)
MVYTMQTQHVLMPGGVFGPFHCLLIDQAWHCPCRSMRVSPGGNARTSILPLSVTFHKHQWCMSFGLSCLRCNIRQGPRGHMSYTQPACVLAAAVHSAVTMLSSWTIHSTSEVCMCTQHSRKC